MDEHESSSISNLDEQGKKIARRGPSRTLKYPIPPGKISFDSHLKVLKALNVGSNKGKNFVSYSEIAPYANIHETAVSKILNFFNDIGFTEIGERGKYKPKSEIIAFLNDLEWEQPLAETALGHILLGTWFGQSVIQFFQLNKEASKEDLIRVFGKCAQADQSNQAALMVLIKYLEYGKVIGLIENSSNYHLLINQGLEIKPQSSPESIEIPIKKEEIIKKDSPSAKSTIVNSPHKNVEEKQIVKVQSESTPNLMIHNISSGGFSVHINISIDETTNVDIIAEKILRLRERIK